VVWWASTFDHHARTHRAVSDRVVPTSDGLEMRLLHGPGYQRSIGLRRLVDHRVLAWKFRRDAPALPRPDVVLACLPTIELAREATLYGRRRGIPVVVDIRDRWPDPLLGFVPAAARSLVRLALAPYYAEVRTALRNASSIYGITRPFVDWGLGHAGRGRRPGDLDFPLASDPEPPSPAEETAAQRFWREHGVAEDGSEPIVSFFGQFNHHARLEDVIESARLLERSGARFRFILAGTGPDAARYRRLAQGVRSVILPGWVGRPEVWTGLRMSAVGLAPYARAPDFLDSLPNKSIEYLAAGLPILTTLDGVLGELLRRHGCGIVYSPGRPDELAALLLQLGRDKQRLMTMSRAARALHAQRFRGEDVYARMAAALEDLARRGERGCE
jgi:glycosyltransferase involved in cell wall biosynthesis